MGLWRKVGKASAVGLWRAEGLPTTVAHPLKRGTAKGLGRKAELEKGTEGLGMEQRQQQSSVLGTVTSAMMGYAELRASLLSRP